MNRFLSFWQRVLRRREPNSAARHDGDMSVPDRPDARDIWRLQAAFSEGNTAPLIEFVQGHADRTMSRDGKTVWFALDNSLTGCNLGPLVGSNLGTGAFHLGSTSIALDFPKRWIGFTLSSEKSGLVIQLASGRKLRLNRRTEGALLVAIVGKPHSDAELEATWLNHTS